MTSGVINSEILSRSSLREANQSTHKPQCKHFQHHRAIYRIGDFAQALFYDWAELFFYESLDSVTQAHDHIRVVRNNDPQLPGGLHEQDIFARPFPSPSIMPADCQNAVLSFRMCTSAVAFFWIVLEHFFKDLHITIHELNITQHHTPNRIILHTPSSIRDAKSYNHTIFRIDLNLDGTNESFALDLTSAQFGFKETVMPWAAYVRQRGAKVKDVHDFGYHAQMLHVFDEDPGWDVKIGVAVLVDGMLRHGSTSLPSREQLLELDDGRFGDLSRGTWIPGVCGRMRMGLDFLCEKGLARFVNGCGVVVGKERRQYSLMECILASRSQQGCEH